MRRGREGKQSPGCLTKIKNTVYTGIYNNTHIHIHIIKKLNFINFSHVRATSVDIQAILSFLPLPALYTWLQYSIYCTSDYVTI